MAKSVLSQPALKKLEATADAAPHDTRTQLKFIQALEPYPDAVIRRFENRDFQMCEQSAREYVKALTKTGKINKLNFTELVERVMGRHPSNAAVAAFAENALASNPAAQMTESGNAMSEALAAAKNQQASSFQRPSFHTQPSAYPSNPNPMPAFEAAGLNPSKPLHVTMIDGAVGMKSQAWRTLRVVAVTFILVTAVGALMDDKGLSSRLTGTSSNVQQAESSSATFKDVVGVDEAKEELQEIVEYLRNPEKFTRLGGKLPRGMLLMGPPGTGKTLLAKAIAGEAGVPFFYSSGSQFEEVYVGVGARRVRDLFEAAKKKSPCIIFIDEIDAVGGSRKLKDQSAMKQTLNELLVQMDGFAENSGIIVIGATNFAKSLDNALTRPGRFDKHVTVPLPDVKGRKEILELYAQKTKMGDDADLSVLARGTPGMSGAELFNLVNQAAIKASVDGLNTITHACLEWARDKVLMGPERKSALITPENAKKTAYHEAGHALVALRTDGAHPVHQATIMPRGQALGMVQQLPEGDQTSESLKQMLAYIDVCMGGRIAEELIFGYENVTSGAYSDIEQATKVARNMVTKYGFSDVIGVVNHGGKAGEEDSSEATRQKIDEEVRRILDESYARATELLKKYNRDHERLAQALIEYETLTGQECRDLVFKGIKPRKVVVKSKDRGGGGARSILGGKIGIARETDSSSN